jgi:hypothetical protein
MLKNVIKYMVSLKLETRISLHVLHCYYSLSSTAAEYYVIKNTIKTKNYSELDM